LENPWKTRFLRVLAIPRQKIPFVFNSQKSGVPNFQKHFFGRFVEFQTVTSEKVWKCENLAFAPFSRRPKNSPDAPKPV
jgi:hypothetical protein